MPAAPPQCSFCGIPETPESRLVRGRAANICAACLVSSRELLENVVRPPLRDLVLAVVDDVADTERLLRIGKARSEENYGALLGAMIDQGGEVGVLAAYHASELGLRDSVRGAARKLDASRTAFGGELSVPERAKPLETEEVPA